MGIRMLHKNRLAGILIVLSYFAFAQEPKSLSEIQSKYPFLLAEKGGMTYYGDSAYRDAFFQKLEELNLCGEGTVNISHFGGSHVQAGTLPRKIWKNLNLLYPPTNGAPGFVFPFNIGRTNNPRHYYADSDAEWTKIRAARPSDTARWGMSAITIYTRDTSGYVRMYNRADDSAYWVFDQVRIFTPIGDTNFVITPDSSMGVVSTRVDSAAGMIEWKLSHEKRELLFHWSKNDSVQSVMYLDGVQLSNSRPGIVFNAMGANGNSTRSLIRSTEFESQVPYLETDLAIFGIGINDAHKPPQEFDVEEYKENYRKIIASLRRANPKMAILFITNNDSYYGRSPNPNALEVRRAMIELAEEQGAWVFDLFEYMGGMRSSVIWYRQGLGKKDKIHFTPEGYQIQADAMYQALEKDFFNYLRKQYPIQNKP